ncbi:MAG TPA: ATP-binding cassette domain-containing protein [Anaerolineaceae bacterium]|nr:ATP-binding cassette domain-containing protein [Anaerolineaceae bacterium]
MMPNIIVDRISKAFGNLQAVKNVSFEVNPGEIFGLLGPNGAGKTTSIRIILDIFKADSGTVSILGGAMTEEKKNRIGYLPEERGLYQDIQLERCLVYLATLKGLEESEARGRINDYLQKFDLADARKKKVKELSKGMQQKAQLITTLVHKPEVVIIDEPFSALDPVNTQMVKDLLKEERHRGTTIVMCTHQMHQVEELADRIALINAGETVLYGGLTEIRRRFASDGVLIRAVNPLPSAIPGVQEVRPHNSNTLLKLESGKTPQEVLNTLIHQGVILEHFEIALPSLDEIFIQVVNHESERK